MRHILVEINCRQCGYHTHIKSHTLVKPELEPNLRERILHHTMFTYKCPCCHYQTTFVHNFLYHDADRRFLVYMSRDGDAPSSLRKQFPDQTLRQVSDPQDLAEVIKIREDGLDDRIMARIKTLLYKKDGDVDTIRYHDFDLASQTVWLEYTYRDHGTYKAIAAQTYEQFVKNHSGKEEHFDE